MRVCERGGIAWSGRIAQRDLRRLYESDASGAADDALLDEVGYALYARVMDILYVRDFLAGVYRCPRCREAEMLGDACPACGFAFPRAEMRESFRKKQLNPGGAVPAFERFTAEWAIARDARAKMRAIDRVIHAFHYSLAREPDLPTRAAGVNLIEGNLTDVVAFLDDLSASEEFRAELQKNRALLARFRSASARADEPWGEDGA